MLAPPNIVESAYKSLIFFSIESIVDGSVAYGRQIKKEKRDLQDEDEYETSFEEETEAINLGFNYTVEEHSKRFLKF